MARVSKSILPFRLVLLFFFAAPALISILGPRVVVSADSLYRRRLTQDYNAGPVPAIYRRKFLGIDKIEPGLGHMSGLPGAIANLGLMLWGQKAKPVDKSFTEAGGFAQPSVYTKRTPGKPVDKSFSEAGGFAAASVYSKRTLEGPHSPVDLICVSGFGRTTKQEDLEAAFNKCEGVAKVTLSDGGKSALITMLDPHAATRCVGKLDHSIIHGHHIVVHESETGHCGASAEKGSPESP